MASSHCHIGPQLLLTLLLVGILLFGCLPEAPPAMPTPVPVCQGLLVDALFYHLDVHLTPLDHHLEVTAAIRLRWRPGTTVATFHLDPRLKVDAAQVNGEPVTTTTRQGQVTVSLPTGSTIADQATITLHYAGAIDGPPPGMNVWPWPDHIGAGSVALGGTDWYPHPNVFAQDLYTATLTIWVPPELTAIATGSPAGQEETATGIGYCWRNDVPINRLALVAGVYESRSVEVRGVTLTAYARPELAQGLPRILNQAQEVLEVYQEAFTPYPYRHLKVVDVKTGVSGDWSFPTLVLLQARGGTLSAGALPHEMAHQWWGGQIMPCGSGDMWLAEGLATYSQFVYYRLAHSKPNPGELAYVIQVEQTYLLHISEGEETSIGDISGNESVEQFTSIAYLKGSLVFRMLEYLLGQETFARCLHAYAERYRFQNPTLKNFQSLCEELSEQDLGWFFEQWLWTTKRLDYTVEKVEVREGAVTVHVRRKGAAVMPVEVRVTFADGSQETQRWDGQAEQGQVIFQTRGCQTDKVELDPDHWLLDVDRLNNTATVPAGLG